MGKQSEISRFTGSGKTFFFNRGAAENGTEYLTINALYGKGRYERMVLFPPHFLEFRKHLQGAVEALQDVKFSPVVEETPYRLERHCSQCGASWTSLEIAITSETEWAVVCKECGATAVKFGDGNNG